MMVNLVVESRIVAYGNPNDLPHVFSSVSVPVELPQLDNSQNTLDAVSQAVALGTKHLDELFDSTIKNDTPAVGGESGVNELDANSLRQLLALIDQGKVRIIASQNSKRQGNDPVWYCLKIKRVE